MLLYETNQFFPVRVVYLCFLDKKRIPDIESIASTGSFSNLLQETIAVFESQAIFPFHLCKFWICKQECFVQKISPQSGAQIEYIHLYWTKKNRPKRYYLYMMSSCNTRFLREEVYFSFSSRMTDSSTIRKTIFHELPAQ